MQLRGHCAGAVLGDAAQKRHHGARGLLVDDFLDGRRVLPERDAIGIRHLADEPRRNADAVVGEDGVGCYLLLERDPDRSRATGR